MSYLFKCTICGDTAEFGKIHKHNPNGRPIDIIKMAIMKFAPTLWDENED